MGKMLVGGCDGNVGERFLLVIFFCIGLTYLLIRRRTSVASLVGVGLGCECRYLHLCSIFPTLNRVFRVGWWFESYHLGNVFGEVGACPNMSFFRLHS